MSDFVVWGIPGSPYVRAALLALAEKGQDWTLARLKGSDLKAPEHLARQPFGRMPAFQHRDFRLYETQAILRYIDRVAPDPPLTPADPEREARMNQLMGIADWYLMPQVSAAISFPRVVAPALGLPVDDSGIAAALPAARHCLAEIARLLDGQTWLVGECLSLADLLVGPQLSMLSQSPEGQALLSAHANLTDWLTRLEERPSMRLTTWAALERVP